MTYECESTDPMGQQLVCTASELERAGFTVRYRDEMPEHDSDCEDPIDAAVDAVLASGNLEDPEVCAAALRLIPGGQAHAERSGSRRSGLANGATA